jgi:hypothetical protein
MQFELVDGPALLAGAVAVAAGSGLNDLRFPDRLV